MKIRPAALTLILLSIPATAHRLDEYLQATMISLEKDRIQVQIRLTAGIAVFPVVMGAIDTDGDGIFSRDEQHAYAERVRRDVSLAIDGDRLDLEVTSTNFPPVDAMKEGLGEIEIGFAADVPAVTPERKLTFENHHLRPIAAYLVNCLLPRDPDIRVTAQNRDYQQSLYRLEYVQDGIRAVPPSLAWWSDASRWSASLAMLLLAALALFWRMRRADALGDHTHSA